MKRKIAAFLLTGIFAVSMFAGCGSTAQEAAPAEAAPAEAASEAAAPAAEAVSEPAAAAASEAAATGEYPSYSIALNTFGAGAYPLDEIMLHDKQLAEATGMEINIVDNQFTADVVVSQLENQLQANPDIVIPELMAETTFDPVTQKCIDAGVAFAFDDSFPSDEKVLERCFAYEAFCGGCTSDPQAMGAQMAELAFADGNKTALILAGNIGNYGHDNRIIGFTNKFEELGGEVLQVAHCADPSEAVQKGTDLITANPDADCIYNCSSDYLEACVSIVYAKGLDTMLYGTDVNPNNFEDIKAGNIRAVNGGHSVDGSIAMTLAINYMDGCKIVDENGQAPMFNILQAYVVSSDNVDKFVDLYANGCELITADGYKNLLYRYNPEVSYDTYVQFLSHYGDDIQARIGA